MLPIVPQPAEVTELEGDGARLGSHVRLVTGCSVDEVGAGVLLAGVLGGLVGRSVEVVQTSPTVPAEPGDIVLRIDPTAGPAGSTSEERYTLESREDAILLAAPGLDGLHRAIATFGQLLESTQTGGYRVPAVRVLDEPRYSWRGLSLDVARHFFGVDEVKRVISLMARHKLNVLHLHLSDDQGWRIEIPSRPLLSELGATTSVDGGTGGFYTVEDFTELQAFARARGITVVPEIDVPGHVNAALHACPELSADGLPKPVYTGIEVGFSSLDAALPATAEFLRDVFTDLAAMTEGPWVHLGGDEAHDTAPQDYATLVTLAADTLRAAGKTPVGWQELASTSAARDAVVQLWDTRLPLEPLAAAAGAGAKILLSPADRVYLDQKYYEGYPLGLDWAGFVELRDSYDWDPDAIVPGLGPDAVVGVEAAVWTERITTMEELTTMLLPRLTAVAEVAWSMPERRDWDSFVARVRGQWRHWEAQGLAWYPSPQVDWEGR